MMVKKPDVVSMGPDKTPASHPVTDDEKAGQSLENILANKDGNDETIREGDVKDEWKD